MTPKFDHTLPFPAPASLTGYIKIPLSVDSEWLVPQQTPLCCEQWSGHRETTNQVLPHTASSFTPDVAINEGSLLVITIQIPLDPECMIPQNILEEVFGSFWFCFLFFCFLVGFWFFGFFYFFAHG